VASLASTFATFGHTVLSNRYIPHLPTTKQAEFLAHIDEAELLYGGAAGGGKSDAMIMAALQFVHVPDYRALLLRRTFPDLAMPGAIMDRAKQWLMGTDARWVASEKSFVFPSGASLTFGYLDSDNDKYRYQGSEFQFVGFDELTQFTEQQYTYLFSRLRRLVAATVPVRMRAATNPGGIGHAWVHRRFIDPATATAAFISARLEDNPHIGQAEYEEALSKLDPATRKQLREGLWQVDDPGALWRREWIDRNRVLRVPEGVEIVRMHVALDPSATPGGDEAGIVTGGKGSNGLMYVIADDTLQGSPDAWGRATVRAYHRHKADKIIYEANQGGEMVRHVLRTVDANVPMQKVWASRGKVPRAQPIAALTEQNKIKFVGEFVKLEDELCGWTPERGESPNRLDAFVWLGASLLRRGNKEATAS
jgi:phage terminase large subunit-like protein